MNWEAWAAIATVVLVIVAMVRGLGGPDTVLLWSLFVFMTLGLFDGDTAGARFPDPVELMAGFSNEGVVTIAILFVVAEGLRQTGALSLLSQSLLGRPKSILVAQARLMFPVAGLSAFMNNTPIVAMFIPIVRDWCRKTGFNPSKLFIPLSYAAIMGGSCTLIGTATNIFVRGMVQDAQAFDANGPLKDVHIGMFTITKVGLPATLVGIGYLLVMSRRLLPDRVAPSTDVADARRYTVEMLVEPGSAIDGKSIEQAGLRHLPGVFLAEIDRDGERLVAVGPEQRLHGNDRLIFVGLVDSVVDLQRTRGLMPATDQVFKIADPRPNRQLVEAVVSDSCPVVGRSIREGRFRTVYNAAVIAVHRNGHRLADQKIGDIVLHSGDTLLMETHPRFVSDHRNSADFFLVSAVAGSNPVRHEMARFALLVLVTMVILAATNTVSLMHAALGAAGVFVLTRCCNGYEARQAINWRVLLAMGAAMGVGKSLDQTGAAMHIGELLLSVCRGLGPWGLVAGVYLIAMVFNSLIGPIGSAALVFPIAKEAASGAASDFTQLAITIMMAASASFATPISYQTNLMVYGAGGYRFSDYIRVGLPLNLLIMMVTVALVPLLW